MKLLGWIGCLAVVSALASPATAQARDYRHDDRQRNHYSDRRTWSHREHRGHGVLEFLFSDRDYNWRRSGRYYDRGYRYRAPYYGYYGYDRRYGTYGYYDRYGTYDSDRYCD